MSGSSNLSAMDHAEQLSERARGGGLGEMVKTLQYAAKACVTDLLARRFEK